MSPFGYCHIKIIGIGNPYCHDDGLGVEAAQRIASLHLPHITVLERSGEGAALMQAWQDADCVYLIDAVRSGAPAGTIYRLDAHARPVLSSFFNYSSHAFSVAEAVEMARRLGQVPARLIVYGIEGANFAQGVGLSRAVQVALDALVARLHSELLGTAA